jgi:hypothetical protein
MNLRVYWPGACPRCHLKERCSTGDYRRIRRWEHENTLEAMQRGLDRRPDAMTIRRSTVEHVFGTLKHWMGPAHFLTRTLKRVSTDEPERACLQPEAGHENTWRHRDVEGHDSDQRLSPEGLCWARDARMVQTRHIELDRPDRQSSASPRKRRFHTVWVALCLLRGPVGSAALVGQYQVPPQAVDQTHSRPLFQRTQSLCDSGRRHIELARGVGERGGRRDLDEKSRSSVEIIKLQVNEAIR